MYSEVRVTLAQQIKSNNLCQALNCIGTCRIWFLSLIVRLWNTNNTADNVNPLLDLKLSFAFHIPLSPASLRFAFVLLFIYVSSFSFGEGRGVLDEGVDLDLSFKCLFFFFNYIISPPPPVALRPNADHDLPILEVSRSHSTTHRNL